MEFTECVEIEIVEYLHELGVVLVRFSKVEGPDDFDLEDFLVLGIEVLSFEKHIQVFGVLFRLFVQLQRFLVKFKSRVQWLSHTHSVRNLAECDRSLVSRFRLVSHLLDLKTSSTANQNTERKEGLSDLEG